MKIFFRPTFLVFLLLQIIAIGLALHQPSRDEIYHFWKNPSIYVLEKYDTLLSPEIKILLAEHFPNIFFIPYVCGFEMGLEKKTAYPNQIIETQDFLGKITCSKNLTIALAKHSNFKMYRGPNAYKSFDIEKGSAYISLDKGEIIYLHAPWGITEIKALAAATLVFKKDKNLKILYFLSGESSLTIQPFAETESYIEPLYLFKSEGGKAMLQFKDKNQIELYPKETVSAEGSKEFLLIEPQLAAIYPPAFGTDEIHPNPMSNITLLPVVGISSALQRENFSQNLEFPWSHNPLLKGNSCNFTMVNQNQEKTQKESMSFSAQIDGIKSGKYFWYVQCIINGEHIYSPKQIFQVIAFVQIDDSKKDFRTTEETAQFSWKPFIGAQSYEVHFSLEKSFKTYSKVLTTENILHAKLPKGSYFWRVIAFGKNQQQISIVDEIAKVTLLKPL